MRLSDCLDYQNAVATLPASLLSLKNSCCRVDKDPMAFEMLPHRMFEDRLTTSMLLKTHIGSSVPGSGGKINTFFIAVGVLA